MRMVTFSVFVFSLQLREKEQTGRHNEDLDDADDDNVERIINSLHQVNQVARSRCVLFYFHLLLPYRLTFLATTQIGLLKSWIFLKLKDCLLIPSKQDHNWKNTSKGVSSR